MLIIAAEERVRYIWLNSIIAKILRDLELLWLDGERSYPDRLRHRFETKLTLSDPISDTYSAHRTFNSQPGCMFIEMITITSGGRSNKILKLLDLYVVRGRKKEWITS